MLRSLSQIPAQLLSRERRIRVAVVCGTDASTASAVVRAIREGFVSAVFVGRTADARAALEREIGNAAGAADPSFAEHLRFAEPDVEAFCAAAAEEATRKAEATGKPVKPTPKPDDAEAPFAAAADEAARLVSEGEADFLMKGLVSTDTLLRAMLSKRRRLVPKGSTLTHVALTELPREGRLLAFTDSAVIPFPTPEQRREQVGAVARVVRALGADEPRIALTHCSEHVSPHFPYTADYAAIIDEANAGRWGRVIVDGPLDLRTSLDAVALRTKGIASPLEGRADALVLPNIESANVLYKAVTFLLGAQTAGILAGAACPVILSSRGDDADTKFFSIALAALLC